MLDTTYHQRSTMSALKSIFPATHTCMQYVEASTYNRLTQTSQKIMQISREIRGEWLPNLHHLATYQSEHCRRPSDHTFPPPHSGTCTCFHSPTAPPPTHHLVLPPPPSQRDPPLHLDLPTTSSGHEQYVNLHTAPYLLILMHAQSARPAGNSHNGAPTPEKYLPCLASHTLRTMNDLFCAVSITCLWLKPYGRYILKTAINKQSTAHI